MLKEDTSKRLNSDTACDILFLVILHEEWCCFLESFEIPTSKVEYPSSDENQSIIAKVAFNLENYNCVAACLNPDAHAQKQQGKVPAAILTTQLVPQYSPRVIVNVGIAGRLHDDVRIGGVVFVTDIFDATGNAAASDVGSERTYEIIQGNVPITCDKDIFHAFSKFRLRNRAEFEQWKKQCEAALTAAGCPHGGEIQKDGILASGDPVAKSEQFKKALKTHNRNILGYEMEAYAIAQAAQVTKKSARLIVIKGLSDNANRNKNEEELGSRGTWRTVAATNAFHLLKLVLRKDVLGEVLNRSWNEPSQDGNALHRRNATIGSETTSVEGIAFSAQSEFPYFQEDEILEPAELARHLLSEDDYRIECLRSSVETRAPSAVRQLESKTRSAVANFLNQAIDADLTQYAEYWVRKDTRAYKVWRDGSRLGSTEHRKEIVNRAVVDELLFRTGAVPQKCKAPILTCLVEDTGHYRVMETFKERFQKTHRVIIDFDAKSLAQLYTITDNELIIDKTQKYDVFFHYHLSINKLFSHNVLPSVATVIPGDIDTFLREELFENVAEECCYTINKAGEKEIAALPVNANSMVLLVNRTLFEKNRREFEKFAGGTMPLRAPRTWSHFRKILDYFYFQKEPGIVLQQKREGDSLYFEWCNFAHSMGKGIIDKKHGWERSLPNHVTLGSPETIEATQFYADLKKYHPQDVPANECDGVKQIERFAQGDIPMAIVWSDLLFKFFDEDPSRKENYTANVIPGGKSMVGGGLVCINENSTNADIAKQFLRELLSRHSQVELLQSGWCSAYQAAYTDPSSAHLPYADAVQKSLARACHMIEAGPWAHRVRDLVGRRLEDAVYNDYKVAEIMTAAAAELKEELSYAYVT